MSPPAPPSGRYASISPREPSGVRSSTPPPPSSAAPAPPRRTPSAALAAASEALKQAAAPVLPWRYRTVRVPVVGPFSRPDVAGLAEMLWPGERIVSVYPVDAPNSTVGATLEALLERPSGAEASDGPAPPLPGAR